MTINLPKMTVKCENKKCKKVFERYTYQGENVQKYWCPECVKKAREYAGYSSNPNNRGV